MNPNAKPFIFNAAASEWKPTFTPPPAPVAAPLPPPPPVTASTATPSATVPINSESEIVSEPLEDVNEFSGEVEDENDPLWIATLLITNGDKAAAAKLLEDPDKLMIYPEIRAILESTPVSDNWEDVPAPVVETQAAVTVPIDNYSSTSATVAIDNLEEGVLEDAAIQEGDPREHLNIVFIGHVDAGKSTLSGNILYIMGMVDQRTIEKYEREAKQRNRESWYFAFIMDTSEEERAKGKTVEVGRAFFHTDTNRYTILDAPGHKNYVPNMIAGAAQADVGILVISARKGEFETGFEKGGQTREHALLAKTLGVKYLIVVINKMDDPTVMWDLVRYEECVNKLKPYLKSCGYAIKKDVRFIPISALSGDNLLRTVPPEKCPWWAGLAAAAGTPTTLLGTLDGLVISGRNPDAPLRIPVLDRYFERGTVVMGKVEAGTLRLDDEITMCPTKKKAKVEGIYIGETKVRSAKPGENVLIKFSINPEDVQKGYVISSSISPCRALCEFKVQLALVDLLDHRPIFSPGYDCVMHVHTAEVEVTCVQLVSVTDKKGQQTRRPFAKTGQMCIARLTTPQSTCMETYESLPACGRLTLRDEGTTIAIGKIIELIR